MTTQPQPDQGDRLMWMLGGAVGVVALVSVTLVFWPAQETQNASETAATITTAVVDLAAGGASATAISTDDVQFSSRLNRAQLALDAGMLLEPEGFSAWSLFAEILEIQPDHAEAAAGLAAVAEALVGRARLAASERRDGEADALIEQVLVHFPNHPEALEIRDRERVTVSEITPRPPAPRRQQSVAPPQPIVTPPQARGEPSIDLTITRRDRVVEMYPEFTRALASGALISPPERNAEAFVNEMRAIDPVHAMTRDAELQLFEALFARHEAAFDSLDTEAALEWLAAADRISIDATRVAAARQDIIDFISARATSEHIPVSMLTTTHYVSPEYPSLAQRRGISGWVDIEFLLGADGVPRDIIATDSSHQMFEEEAIEAVAQWRLEPHRIMGRVVEQQVQARIRFVLE